MFNKGGETAASSPRTLYWRSNTGTAARDGDWKLILSKDGKRAELFDLAADPYEAKDLASAHPDRVAALREKLEAIRAADEVR